MKKSTHIIVSITIYIVIDIIAIFLIPKYIDLGNEMAHRSFVTHTSILLISGVMIYLFQKYKLLQFNISKIRFKQIFKPILITIASLIVVNMLINSALHLFKIDIPKETHIAFAKMTTLQLFLFVFIYASIAEEMLSRGFLQNALHPLRGIGIKIRTIKISLPVIISGVLFGLGHIVLINTGASTSFLIRIVINTTIIGIIAGYFQEKHNNTSYAILVHMTANLPGVIASFLI